MLQAFACCLDTDFQFGEIEIQYENNFHNLLAQEIKQIFSNGYYKLRVFIDFIGKNV
jgi:hypothetical protein